MTREKTTGSIAECSRCCTCCIKGGPAFHLEDRKQIEDGTILLKHLYTIRRGEPGFDNVANRVVPADTDIIKMRGKKNLQACTFLDQEASSCRIYDKRPLECRVLKCWDTREIERVYSRNRLTRKDLLGDVADVWQLVSDHERRCRYDAVQEVLASAGDGIEESGIETLREIIGYDTHLRSVLAEKGGMDPELMDFLFGRPMRQTIRHYRHPMLFRL
jgi:Fe-S-cluster containining protein